MLRLLLITNRKSYTGSRLPPISMTLDNLERLNKALYGFFGDFGLRDTFQERIAPKPIEIDRQAAYGILSTERRFRRSKSRFSRFKETCAQGHQRAVPP